MRSASPRCPGPPPTALVANLPYNVSVPVPAPSPDAPAVAASRTGDGAVRGRRPAGSQARSKVYGVPSVKAAWFADVRRAGAIGRNVFWPAPNVDSGLVYWTHREPPTSTVPRERVFAVIDAAFAHRRKALRGALKGLAGAGVEGALERAGVDPLARGESLAIEDFVRIAEELAVEGPGIEGPGIERPGNEGPG